MKNCGFTVLVFLFLPLMAYSQDPTVQSQLGEIVGTASNIHVEGIVDRNVHEYLGIPFAEPPIGDMRFRKSVLMTSLASPFDAKSYGAICPQSSWNAGAAGIPQSEDCLSLNIHVPERNETIPEESPDGYPVMVWIHGGGFTTGASRYFNGSTIAAVGNIIVVTVNYRVGVFGFLSTGDENEPGNFGLWDQHLALKWVNRYIGDFGGDNQKVTLAGVSAGSISVTQQAISPKINRGLIQRIIAQSGSITNPSQGVDRDGWNDTMNIANTLGCNTDSKDEMMMCLRKKSVNEYLTMLQTLSVTFGPLIDNDLIEMNPTHIVKESKNRNLDEVDFFRSLDILSGFSAFEGAFTLPFILGIGKVETIQPTREEMAMYLPMILNMEIPDAVNKLVMAQYTNWTNPDDYNSVRLNMAKVGGDRTFCAPAIEMARLHKSSASGKNFMYHFAPKPSTGPLLAPSWVTGAIHTDEVYFVFGDFGKIGNGDENAWEKELSVKMMTYWSNFVKTGDPNSQTSVSPKWPGYNLETGDYLLLDKVMSAASAKQQFYAEEANFWLEMFPDIVAAVEDKENCGGGGFTNAATKSHVYCSFSVFLIICFASIFMF